MCYMLKRFCFYMDGTLVDSTAVVEKEWRRSPDFRYYSNAHFISQPSLTGWLYIFNLMKYEPHYPGLS